MKYAICIDNNEPIETIKTNSALTDHDRRMIVKDFCKRNDIGNSGVCVRYLPDTQPVARSV